MWNKSTVSPFLSCVCACSACTHTHTSAQLCPNSAKNLGTAWFQWIMCLNPKTYFGTSKDVSTSSKYIGLLSFCSRTPCYLLIKTVSMHLEGLLFKKTWAQRTGHRVLCFQLIGTHWSQPMELLMEHELDLPLLHTDQKHEKLDSL